MASREIAIWVDERWYDALSKRLKDETLEQHLEEIIDEMCNELPRQEYERISAEIWQEEQQRKQKWEESKRLAVFHVREDGEEVYLQTERDLEFLDTARLLRRYLREESDTPVFAKMLNNAEEITAEQFQQMVALRMENTGKVTGAFELDFDAQTIASLNVIDGWMIYNMKDVSTAAYFANKKWGLSEQERRARFSQRLNGKAFAATTADIFLQGQRKLTSEDISFSDEIMQNENLLEFYMDVIFPPEEVFGKEVRTCDSGFVNLYVNYDMESGQVCDMLEVYLVRDNGTEQPFKYRLSHEECAILLSKMDNYCKENMCITLDEARAQYLSEQEAPQVEPTM